MSTQATGSQLCVCGLDTLAVLLIALAIAIAYGELLAHEAVRRMLLDRARHRGPRIGALTTTEIPPIKSAKADGTAPT